MNKSYEEKLLLKDKTIRDVNLKLKESGFFDYLKKKKKKILFIYFYIFILSCRKINNWVIKLNKKLD